MDKLTQAKQVPIESLYPGQLRKVGKLLRGKCPFHSDNGNPNFFIYPETNSWYCFMERIGGDSIKYVMLLKNLDFKQALEELT